MSYSNTGLYCVNNFFLNIWLKPHDSVTYKIVDHKLCAILFWNTLYYTVCMVVFFCVHYDEIFFLCFIHSSLVFVFVLL